MKKFLLLSATCAVIFGLFALSPYADKEEAPVVQVIQPKMMSIQDMVTLHGTVVDPDRKKLYAACTSYVAEVLVSEGDTVKAGQKLIRLKKTNADGSVQSAAVSALGQLKETLEAGALQDAQIMLEDMIRGAAVPVTADITQGEYALYSPCDGVIVKVSAVQGATVGTLLPCIEIMHPNRLQICVTAGEEVIGLLQPEMECQIDIPAFSLEKVPGVLNKIDPYAQQTGVLTGNLITQTKIYITPTMSTELLRPGYRATAKVITSLREDVLLLPYEAILQEETGEEYVLKIENRKIVKAYIQSGAELENEAEICSGLTSSDWVLNKPNQDWVGEEIHFVSP